MWWTWCWTILIIILNASLATENLPTFFCNHNVKPGNCQLLNIFLLRDHPRYKIISELSYNDVDTLTFYNQKLAVLSPDFCESFPRLWSLYAASNQIEIVDQDAFASCYNIRSLDISDNQIQVLPGELFRNNYQLSFINLQVNKIGMISDDLFNRNFNLEYIYLSINNLESFPATAVKNCKKLNWILANSNNIFDFNITEILEHAPMLREVMVNGNMMPCSAIRRMVDVFTERDIWHDLGYVPRDRPFRMGEVIGYTCIDGQ